MSQSIRTEMILSVPDRLLLRVSQITGLRPKEINRFLKFATVGALGAVIDFTVLNIMHKVFGLDLLVANAISFTVAVLSNFTWNRLWTFPESRARPIHTQLGQFAVVNVIGLAINEVVLYATHQMIGQFVPDPWDYNLAKALAICVVLFWNYGVNRVWTYKGIK